MRARGWTVRALTELPPGAARRKIELWGDNLNHGERVRLLVRRGTAKRGEYAWIDEDQVFAVFLHELCHIEIGPHDARFYALLETLKREAELNMASDFIVCGRCVGGGAGARAATSPRGAAATAAERRARLARVGAGPAAGGGRRLGGSGTGAKFGKENDPVAAAAAAAAARADRESAEKRKRAPTARDVIVLD